MKIKKFIIICKKCKSKQIEIRFRLRLSSQNSITTDYIRCNKCGNEETIKEEIE